MPILTGAEDSLLNLAARRFFVDGGHELRSNKCDLIGMSEPHARTAMESLAAKGLVRIKPYGAPFTSIVGIPPAGITFMATETFDPEVLASEKFQRALQALGR